jgi:ribosomal protein S10
MRFARNFNGTIVDAEKNKVHGNFLCLECNNLAHWRNMSVDNRKPHFYHKIANENCPLSFAGGEWEIQEDSQVVFKTELEKDGLSYPMNNKPDLSKIPMMIVEDSEADKSMARSDMGIRLESSDPAQLDFTVSLFCDFARKQQIDVDYMGILAIPLPVKIKNNGKLDSKDRVHRRFIKIFGAKPQFVEKLSFINIPESVDVSFKITREDLKEKNF